MIKISAVSYTNTIPFIYGLKQYFNDAEIDISFDYPAIVAKKLLNNEAQIGLVPVAVIPELKDAQIITDFCIGAVGPVKSVLLLSNQSIEQVKCIHLDYQSRTSVNLCRVLCKEHWKINPVFKAANENFLNEIGIDEAAVVIGDRALLLAHKFKYVYDLANEWYVHTQLPFVFACWVKIGGELTDDFISRFNLALAFGLEHRDEAIMQSDVEMDKNLLKDYVNKSISYKLDDDKRKGLETFLKSLSKIKRF
jgi:chorismate dehydratase